MSHCIFCQIIAGEKPGRVVYQDDRVTAFHDIHPVAPVHVLIVPNRHIVSVNDLAEADEALMGRMFSVAQEVARREGVAEAGYRLIINTGPHGGQAVFHIHMHLIGGHRMRHPMG